MDAQTMTCKASVWPHRHRCEGYGPLDLRISYRNQPPIARAWPKIKKWVYFNLEQPDERTNLTILKLALGVDLYPSHRTSQHRRKDSTLAIYIKGRITNQMKHPIPAGRYDGTCKYTDQWCLFTFQAVSLQVKPEESRIIVP